MGVRITKWSSLVFIPNENALDFSNILSPKKSCIYFETLIAVIKVLIAYIYDALE